MAEEDEKNQANRLWAINNKDDDRNGIPMWPVAIILVIGAAIVGFLSVPCVSLRLEYIATAPADAPMSGWQMLCEEEGSTCVCRQRAGQVEGGDDCEMGSDLKVRCTKVGAEERR